MNITDATLLPPRTHIQCPVVSIVWDPTSQTPLQYRMSIQEFKDVIRSWLLQPKRVCVIGDIFYWFSEFRYSLFPPPHPLELSPFLWGPMDENSLVSSIFPHSYIVISHQISLNLIFLNTWLVTLGHPRGQSVNHIWRFRYSGTLRSQVVWNSRFWRWKQNALPKHRSLLTIRHGDIS